MHPRMRLNAFPSVDAFVPADGFTAPAVPGDEVPGHTLVSAHQHAEYSLMIGLY